MLFLLQVLAGAVWSAFDVLIILLQAYIFMILPVVYISMAQEGHGRSVDAAVKLRADAATCNRAAPRLT